MKDEERIKKEIENNTQRILLTHFDKLLLGLDTKGMKFESEQEKQNKIKVIKNFVEYRIKEKIIEADSDLWGIVNDVRGANLEDKETDRKLFFRLLKINHSRLFLGPLDLRSKQAHGISNYLKQKIKETDKKKGEEVINRFFKMFETKKL